jgi:nicotinamidase-related amidase
VKQAFGLSIPEQLHELCTPERAALIIYDMQAGIVPQIGNGREIVAGCQQILAAARQAGIRIFFTRHLFLPNRIAGVGQLRRAMVWQRKSNPAETKPLFTSGSPSWQIVPELTPQEDEPVIDKITMSAFEGTYLDLAMRDAQLQVFIIAGIALEVGIEPTVRHGLDLNYIPIVVSDLCGSKTEEVKRRSLDTLEDTGEVIQVKAAELLDCLKR